MAEETENTTEELEDAVRNDPDLRDAAALGIVHRNVAWSTAAGVVPVPLADMVLVGAAQVKMLKELTDLYGVAFTDNLGKSLISTLIGSYLPVSLGVGSVGSLAKAVPGVGSILGLITTPVLAGAATYAVGKVFVQHFESGGTLLDFNPATMREHFQTEFKEGKNAAKSAASGKSKAA
jgi:uncharacterized protein (DUF697 family)